MKPKSIDHILLMVSNVKKTEKFYVKILGKPIYKDQNSVAWKIRDTKLFFGLPFKKLSGNAFDRNRIGLNHLAFAVRTLSELKKWEKKLNDSGIKNSGIIKDKYKNQEYIWFDDPDNIRQEFYLQPSHERFG